MYNYIAAALTGMMILVMLGGCSQDSGNPLVPPASGASVTDQTVEQTFSGGSHEVLMVNTEGNTRLTYSLDLGSATRDVYFIFTNTAPDAAAPAPAIRADETWYRSFIFGGEDERQDLPESAAARGAVRGTPQIAAFNSAPYDHIESRPKSGDGRRALTAPRAPRAAMLGQAEVFRIDAASSVTAHCRSLGTVTHNGETRILAVYVADDCWHQGGSKQNLVTQAMVDALANRFQAAGDDNDVREWISAVAGAPWGAAADGHGELIDGSAANTITLLLMDIDNDNAADGGVAGYFWCKDNFTAAACDYSNERLMIYLDAVLFAEESNPWGASDGIWAINDFWPGEIVSVLAHEFQHMINFYQKAVVRDAGQGAEVWLDELCSLAAEDLVSSRLAVAGPRGVAYDDPSAGAAHNQHGRLPLYNYYCDSSVTAWSSGFAAIKNYAVNYALAAYLSRTWGAARFLRHAVQNAGRGTDAIDHALEQCGSGDDFGSALRKWAAASLLSDRTDTAAEFRYNRGGAWFIDEYEGYEFREGSINLYNYEYLGVVGPYVNTTLPTRSLPRASNRYYRAGSALTGRSTWQLDLAAGVALTVVVR